jgi:predicted outer membrane repeat protein
MHPYPLFLLLGLAASSLINASAQDTLYVHASATGTNDGSSWTNAFTDLRTAIQAAQEFDQIWVAEGMYKPTAALDRTQSFDLDTNVAWYGGFGGWETDLAERDWVLHETILSGNIGDLADSTDNSHHVIYGYLDDGLNVVDGFIIEDGHANGTIAFADGGGGLSMEDSELMLRNCTVRRCHADGGGGGINVTNSRFSMVDVHVQGCISRGNGGGANIWNGYGEVDRCIFFHNRTIGDENGLNGSGGGMLLHGGFTPTDCLFEGNHSNAYGGGLERSSGSLVGCRFVDNTARRDGGALNTTGSAFVMDIYACTFIRNRVLDTGYSGGALSFDGGFGGGSKARVLACTFIGNQAAQDGGAIHVNNARTDLQSCVFDGNGSGRHGGGVAYYSGTNRCRILNSTFVRNNALMQGHALYDFSTYFDSTLIVNSIFRDNTLPEIEHHPSGHEPLVHNSVVQTYAIGTDLFDLDPLFMDPLGLDGIGGNEDDDLRLAAASPCIELGTADTSGLALFHVDAASAMRIVGTLDLGAYELQDCSTGPSAANAPDSLTCLSLVQLQADTPLVGIGRWRVLTPGTGYLSPTPSIQHGAYSPLMRFFIPLGDSYFEWSVEHCGITTRDTVRITRLAVPDAAVVVNAGASTVCPGDSTLLTVEANGATVEWSNGASGEQIHAGPGTYSARLINAAGCTGAWSDPVVVSAASQPPQPSVTTNGSLQLCANSGQSVTLSGPAGQAEYLWSNGATIRTIVVDTAGTFTLTVTNASGCSSVPSQPVDVVVHPQPPTPQLTLANDTAVCPGNTITIGTAQPAHAYQWSNGANTPSITVGVAGQYHLRILDALGCISLRSDTVQLTVHTVVIPAITADGPLVLCAGDLVILTAQQSFATYAWSNGATTPAITVSDPGTYSVAVVDANGCASSSSSVSVVVNPLPPVPVITSNVVASGALNLRVPFIAGASYVWYNDGVPFPNPTGNNLYGVTQVGPFVVTVTTVAGCSSTSAPFEAPVGIAESPSGSRVAVYPNPTDGLCWVQCAAPAGSTIHVRVLDAAGRVVHQRIERITDQQVPLTLDLRALANGAYALHMEQDDQRWYATVVRCR